MTPEFGATVWGRAWLKTIESPTARPDPLLPKARNLARNHRVEDLHIDTGHIQASVTDNKAQHRANITFRTWPDDISTAVQHALAAIPSPRVVPDGDLPDDLYAVLPTLGAELAAPQDEWTATCTCASRRSPCAHLSACIYALVLAIDEQPAVALKLRASVATSPDDTAAAYGLIPIARLDPHSFYTTPHEVSQSVAYHGDDFSPSR